MLCYYNFIGQWRVLSASLSSLDLCENYCHVEPAFFRQITLDGLIDHENSCCFHCWCLLWNVGLLWSDWQSNGFESCTWEDVNGKVQQSVCVLSWHASCLQQLAYLQHQQEITCQFCCFLLTRYSITLYIQLMMMTCDINDIRISVLPCGCNVHGGLA